MRIFFKVLKISLLTFLIAIVALVVAGFLLEDRITKLAVEKLGEKIKAPMGMESVTFSLIDHFPQATIQFKGLWLGAPDTHPSEPIDTLAKFKKFYISVESRPLLDNIFNIQAVEIEDGFAKYLVNEEGLSCYDFLMVTDDPENDSITTSEPLILALDELNLRNVTCYYQDDKLKSKATIFTSELDGSAIIDSLAMSFKVEGGIKLSKCSFDTTNLYQMKQADLKFDLRYETDTLFMEELNLVSEGIEFEGAGKMFFGEEFYSDLNVTDASLDIEEIRKYVPDEYLKDYQLGQLSGKLNLQATIKGIFSDTETPMYDATLVLSKGRMKYQDYPLVRDVKFRGTTTNGILQNNATTAITINSLHLKAGTNQVDLKGSFRNLDQLQYNINSDLLLDLATLKPFVPDTIVHDMKGQVTAHLETKGVIPEEFDETFLNKLLQASRADFQFRNVDIDLDSAVSLHNISGQLDYKNYAFELDSFNAYLPAKDIAINNSTLTAFFGGKSPKVDSLHIDLPSFNLSSKGLSVKGKANIKNPNHPVFSIQGVLDIDLAYMMRFMPDSLVNNMMGNVHANIQSKGVLDLDSIKEQIQDIIYDQSTFNIDLRNVGLNMPDTILNVQHLSGHLNVDPKLITLQNLRGTYQGIDFKFDTTVVKNLFSTVMRNQSGKLEIKGKFQLSDLDYGMLGAFLSNDENEEKGVQTKTENSKSESRNWVYEVKGKLSINSLKYKKALIEDISTLFNISDSLAIIDKLQFRAFDGVMNTSIKRKIESNGEVVIDMKNQIERMDIRKLLHDLDNFDRAEISYENISGVLTSKELFTKITMLEDSIIYPKLALTGDLTLTNGGIFDYVPLMRFAPDIPGDDDLDTLLFKTIESSIFIFQDAFYAPKTYISSTALDISIFGMQSIGEDYQYHLQFKLGEILGGNKKQEKRYAADDDDPKKDKGLRLQSKSIKGVDKSGMDNPNDRELMEAKINKAEASHKLRFHPKLVSFNTDVEEYLIQ